jgi:serine/threonine-protein kinase
MLPDGNTLLFASTSEAGAEGWDKAKLIALKLDRGERKILRTGAADPRYLSSGHIVYVFESMLFALPFDLNSLEVRGGPVPVVPDVRRGVGADIGIAQYAVSDSGTLVYVKGSANDQVSLALADRSGKFKPLPAPSDNVYHPRFNHDESRIAVYRLDGATTSNVWIYEVAQSQWRQLTFNGGDRPLWTPDGRAITYRVGTSLWQIPSDFSGAAAQLPGTDVAGNMGPFDWSSDAEVLLYGSTEGLHAFRPKAAAAKADIKDTLVMKPPEGATLITRASFSPDARWMVYTVLKAEGSLAYVSPFPTGVGGHRKVMNESAASPIWSRDGREIFVNTLGTLQVLGIKTQPAPDWTNPIRLFTMQGVVAPGAGSTNWDITRDAKQILMIVPKSAQTGTANQELQIVLNWNEELKRLVP